MTHDMMTRLQFLRSLGQLGVAAVVLPACGKDDTTPTPDASRDGNQQTPDAQNTNNDASMPDSPPMPQNCASTGATIANNHGHAITVTAAEANAGVDKTYQIEGGADHPHTVLITAANFATLRVAGTVMVGSSEDAGHTHVVTVTCMH
jgi:hypothetical protein